MKIILEDCFPKSHREDDLEDHDEDIPHCPICMHDFDTDFSLMNVNSSNENKQQQLESKSQFSAKDALQHCLPVSCVSCNAAVCYTCVLNMFKRCNSKSRLKRSNQVKSLPKCPYCSAEDAFGDMTQPRFNRAFANLLEDFRRLGKQRKECIRESESEILTLKQRSYFLEHERDELKRKLKNTLNIVDELEEKRGQDELRLMTLCEELKMWYENIERRAELRGYNSGREMMAVIETLSVISTTLNRVHGLAASCYEIELDEASRSDLPLCYHLRCCYSIIWISTFKAAQSKFQKFMKSIFHDPSSLQKPKKSVWRVSIFIVIFSALVVACHITSVLSRDKKSAIYMNQSSGDLGRKIRLPFAGFGFKTDKLSSINNGMETPSACPSDIAPTLYSKSLHGFAHSLVDEMFLSAVEETSQEYLSPAEQFTLNSQDRTKPVPQKNVFRPLKIIGNFLKKFEVEKESTR